MDASKVLRIPLQATAVALLLLCAPGASAQAPLSQSERVNDLLKQLDQSRSTVSGDEWGRALPYYPNLVGIYHVHDRFLIQVAHDSKRQLVFDLFSGRSIPLDEAHGDSLLDLLKPTQLATEIYSLISKTGLSVKSIGSPEQTFSCQTDFSSYLEAKNAVTHAYRSFFVVTRVREERVMFPVCNRMRGHFEKLAIRYREANMLMTDLFDQTFLMFDEGGGYVLRLDSRFTQRSTLGGNILVLDADPINDQFTGDPSVRYKVVMDAIKDFHSKSPSTGHNNIH